MNSKLKLTEVTLIIIDCLNSELAVEALNASSTDIEFAKTVLLSDQKPFNCTNNISFFEIPKIKNLHEYNLFLLKELHKYINTNFCLLIQTDGYVIDVNKWSNDFLKYDYIGSPWVPTEWFMNNKPNEYRVGNGGFSLRSKKLLSITHKLQMHSNEDVSICVFNRNILEGKGIAFAPLNIAKKFSQEKHCEDLNVVAERDCFGFHGKNYSEFHKQKCKDLHFEFYKNSLIKMDQQRLMFFLKNEIGVSESEYFCANFVGNLQVQQIPEEYSQLLTFFKTSNIKKYLELGVANGGSFFVNSIFLQSTASKIHCVDSLEYKNAPHVKQTYEKISSKVNKLKALFPEKEFNFFNQTTDEFFSKNNNKYDCIFIDADHSYQGVKKDYLNSLKCIERGGYLIFHDINNVETGVETCWNEISSNHHVIGVFSHPVVMNCGIGIIRV